MANHSFVAHLGRLRDLDTNAVVSTPGSGAAGLVRGIRHTMWGLIRNLAATSAEWGVEHNEQPMGPRSEAPAARRMES